VLLFGKVREGDVPAIRRPSGAAEVLLVFCKLKQLIAADLLDVD
jgi:hypothetical protein